MQRLTKEYRASLILAAANANASLAPDGGLQSHGSGQRRGTSYRDDHRDLEDFDSDQRDVDLLALSGMDDDDQPTYWYWSYDHPDAGI